jgi:hypothetical protein
MGFLIHDIIHEAWDINKYVLHEGTVFNVGSAMGRTRGAGTLWNTCLLDRLRVFACNGAIRTKRWVLLVAHTQKGARGVGKDHPATPTTFFSKPANKRCYAGCGTSGAFSNKCETIGSELAPKTLIFGFTVKNSDCLSNHQLLRPIVRPFRGIRVFLLGVYLLLCGGFSCFVREWRPLNHKPRSIASRR